MVLYLEGEEEEELVGESAQFSKTITLPPPKQTLPRTTSLRPAQRANLLPEVEGEDGEARQ